MGLDEYISELEDAFGTPVKKINNSKIPYVNIVSQPCPHELGSVYTNSRGLLKLAWTFFKAWLLQKVHTFKIYPGFYNVDGEGFSIQIGKIPNVEESINPFYFDWEIEKECHARDPDVLDKKSQKQFKATKDEYERQVKFKKIQEELDQALHEMNFKAKL